MKDAFYFTFKSLLKIFTFWSRLFGHVEKQLDQRNKVNYKIYDVATWETNNYKAYIGKYQRSKDNQEILSVQNMTNYSETLFKNSKIE